MLPRVAARIDPLLVILGLLPAFGCAGDASQPELLWGQRGVQNGDFVRPRAIAIDAHDHLYIVDFTARIQVYDRDGRYLGLTWTTPDYRNGRPSGLSIDRDGNLIVSDSHYHCFRIYSPEGVELRKFGGEGGSRGRPTRLRQRRRAGRGRQLLRRRVWREPAHQQASTADGNFRALLGQRGHRAGTVFPRRALALGPDGNLYVADACNDRIQVFTREGDTGALLGRLRLRAGAIEVSV